MNEININLLHNFAGPVFQGTLYEVGAILIAVAILIGIILLLLEVIRGTKAFVKGDKLAKTGVLKRGGVVLLIILLLIFISNLG